MLIAEKGWFIFFIKNIAQHASLVYGINNTDCWAQNGCTLSCVFMPLKGLFFNKQDEKLGDKLLCVYFSFLFLSIGPVVHLWFGSPLSC